MHRDPTSPVRARPVPSAPCPPPGGAAGRSSARGPGAPRRPNPRGTASRRGWRRVAVALDRRMEDPHRRTAEPALVDERERRGDDGEPMLGAEPLELIL